MASAGQAAAITATPESPTSQLLTLTTSSESSPGHQRRVLCNIFRGRQAIVLESTRVTPSHHKPVAPSNVERVPCCGGPSLRRGVKATAGGEACGGIRIQQTDGPRPETPQPHNSRRPGGPGGPPKWAMGGQLHHKDKPNCPKYAPKWYKTALL